MSECSKCYDVTKVGWEERRLQANTILDNGKAGVILKTASGDAVMVCFQPGLACVIYPVGHVGEFQYQRSASLHGGHVQLVINGEKVIRV